MKLPRLRQKGNAYYFDTQAKPRRWIALGSDLPAALRQYQKLLRKTPAGTVASMIDRYLDTRPLKPQTRALYDGWATHLVRVFGDLQPDEVTRQDVLRYLDECPRTSYAGEVSLLRMAFEWGVRQGIATGNPCIQTKTARKRAERDRLLSPAEVAAIRAAASPLLRVAIDLTELLALRPSDLCMLRWDAFTDHAQTAKTGARLRFEMTDDLRAVLDDARALQGRVSSLTVLASRSRPVTRHRLGELWRAACKKAGIADAQLRDLRAKAATDADAAGQDAQKILGHTSPQTTRTYLRGRQIVTVEPVKRRRM